MADPVKDAGATRHHRSRFYRWFNERTGINSLMHSSLDEPIPGGARLAYIFGSGLLFIFISQVITGLCLALYYVPSAESAHTSVAYITKQVAAGEFLRSLHYYGSSAMIIVLLLHFLQTFIYGSFKGRRELLWISGALLSFLVLGMGFTGYLLPWDQSAYFATAVGTNIAGEVPLIGPWLTNMLRGGDTLGTLTLSRFYVAHVFLIPGMIFLFIGLHIALFRKAGAAGPISEDPVHPKLPPESFYPRQVLMDMAFAMLLMVGLGFLSYFHPVQLGPIADPANTKFVPRPEWYYLPMFEWLKFWSSRMEVFAVALIPGILALLFFLMPFLDRKLERRPWRRPIPLLAVAIVLVGMIFLGFKSHLDDLRDQNVAVQLAYQEKQAEEYTKAPFTPRMESASGEPVSSAPVSPLVAKGKGIFTAKGCSGCHGATGTGTANAPSLVGITTKFTLPQITELVHHPNAKMLAGHMPSFNLSTPDMAALFSYLGSLGKPGGAAPAPTTAPVPSSTNAAPSAPGASSPTAPQAPAAGAGATKTSGAAAAGEKIFQAQSCSRCHGEAGAGAGNIPPMSGLVAKLSDAQIAKLIQAPNAKMKAGGMPPLAAPAGEIKSVVAYLRSLGAGKTAHASSKPAPSAPGASSPTAPQAPAAGAGATKTSGAAAAGEKIFQAQSCSRCHGEAGAGAGNIPPMSGLVAKLSDAQIAKLIQAPNAKMKAGGMPPLVARAGEIKSVVAYLRSLGAGKTAHASAKPAASTAKAPAAKPETAKTAAPATGSAPVKTQAAARGAWVLAAGRAVFVANGCMACHGRNAQGTHFAPSLIDITKLYPPAQLTNLLHHPKPAMRAGGMPAVMVNDAEMKELVAYLSSLGAATAPATAGQAKETASKPSAPGGTGKAAEAAKPVKAVPLSAEGVRGKALFEHNRCESCHGVDGLNGTVAAPGLAGMASMLPASVLDNLLQHHSTQMKNGNMPPTNMSPASRKAIVAYIRSMPSPTDAK